MPPGTRQHPDSTHVALPSLPTALGHPGPPVSGPWGTGMDICDDESGVVTSRHWSLQSCFIDVPKNDTGAWLLDGRAGFLKQLAWSKGLSLGSISHKLTAACPWPSDGAPGKLEGAQRIRVLPEPQSK